MTTEQTMRIVRKLSKTQFDALGLCCMGMAYKANRRSLQSLVKLRLIEEAEGLIYGPGDSPIDRIPMRIREWNPANLFITYAWSTVCSEREPEEKP